MPWSRLNCSSRVRSSSGRYGVALATHPVQVFVDVVQDIGRVGGVIAPVSTPLVERPQVGAIPPFVRGQEPEQGLHDGHFLPEAVLVGFVHDCV